MYRTLFQNLKIHPFIVLFCPPRLVVFIPPWSYRGFVTQTTKFTCFILYTFCKHAFLFHSRQLVLYFNMGVAHDKFIAINRSGPQNGTYSCLQKSAPSISVLRSLPGRVEANFTHCTTSDRPQQCGSRCASGVPSVFSNPSESCWWRHEGHGNDPFPDQRVLWAWAYDRTSERMIL